MNNKGFTLLELVITIGIISILLAGVAAVFPQWLRQYTTLKETASATEIMDSIAAGIQEEMTFSREREWDTNGIEYIFGDRVSMLPLENEDCTVHYEDGRLTISGQPKIYGVVFDTSFYKDMTVEVTLWEEVRERDEARILLSEIEVYSASGILLCSETKPTVYYNPEVTK